MKTLAFYLFIFAGMLSLASCSDDDAKTTAAAISAQPVIDAAAQGNWKITRYVDSGNDQTQRFAGFTFTFGASSVLTAANGTDTYTGHWSVTDSDSSDDDDSNSSDIDFNIGFASPASFAELSDDWDITAYSANKIELIDVSGGNGGTDYLTFERN